MPKIDYVTAFYHPYIGIVLACTKCGHRVKQGNEAKFCGGCGSEMNVSHDGLYKGHFKALDDFTRD